ncbi:MAG: hypothetical protein IT260_06680 [Saprospiraceae bacterium]|nr:hypothetical protein [Saprospiraceae bacterium]
MQQLVGCKEAEQIEAEPAQCPGKFPGRPQRVRPGSIGGAKVRRDTQNLLLRQDRKTVFCRIFEAQKASQKGFAISYEKKVAIEKIFPHLCPGILPVSLIKVFFNAQWNRKVL